MNETLIGSYYIEVTQAIERYDQDGDIISMDETYPAKIDIYKKNDRYLIADALCSIASFDSIDELLQEEGISKKDITWHIAEENR